jgi:hypothetical protein
MGDNKTVENYLSTYQDFKYEGQAKCNFEDGLSGEVNFTIRLMTNGRIVGDLEFVSLSHREMNYYDIEQKEFTLDGLLKDSEIAVLAENCYFSTFSVKHDFLQGTMSINGKPKFSASKVVFYPKNESIVPRNEVLVVFGLVNIYEMDKVVVNTTIGELELSRTDNLDGLAELMRLFRIPLITSRLILTILPSGSKLGDIISDSIKVVDNFLKITSLSQTVWHDWPFLIAYEKKDNSEEYRQIYRQLRIPKAKTPISRQLVLDSSSFITTAWEGYSDALEKEYGFGLALEWYVESNSGILETKFLNATTCLELLMDKFHRQKRDRFSFRQRHIIWKIS